MKKFLDTGNFLISEILFLKADFRHSGCIHLQSYHFPKKNSDLEIIFAQDPEKVTKFIQLILDADWLDFATFIASIHRNNKFCLCLARRNQSRRKKRYKFSNGYATAIPPAYTISDPASVGVNIQLKVFTHCFVKVE